MPSHGIWHVKISQRRMPKLHGEGGQDFRQGVMGRREEEKRAAAAEVVEE
jgi:hypothetical protein